MTRSSTTDYDCLIIGGGIAGLTCGIACLRGGLSCAVISAGMNALHFSSGSIDLLGHFPGNTIVHSPLETLPEFIAHNPAHPYARCGADHVREALSFFQKELAGAGLPLNDNNGRNHFHVTALGTTKPTFLSQPSVFSPAIKTAFEEKADIAIINVRGFRDFHPELAAANLKKHPLFATTRITRGQIELPEEDLPGRVHEMRSVDIARILDTAADLGPIARRLRKACGRADCAGMPAFLGIDHHDRVLTELRRQSGVLLYEVPTLPPSILGMRLDNALKSLFAALGGVFIAGESVSRGRISGGAVDHIETVNQGDTLRAETYVLSTGSFFSKGLSSRFQKIEEPVFDLQPDPDTADAEFAAARFFAPESHLFLSAGVVTDETLRPCTRDGRVVDNLYCAGAVLAGYNPIAEGSGGGVAIATGYRAAREIIDRLGATGQNQGRNTAGTGSTSPGPTDTA